jgi:putative membrane protein
MKLAKESILFKAVQKFGTLAAIILFSGGISVLSLNRYAILGFLFGALLLVGLTAFWEYLVWKNYDFFFGESNLNIEHGVIRRKHREIPLSRIQNVDIQRNIFQRMFGIAKVNLETAGGNTTEASLKYVDLETGRDIQKKFRRLKQVKEPEEEEENDDRELIFELEPRELFLLGVTSVNTKVIFGIFAFLGVGGSVIGGAVESQGLGFTAVAMVLTFLGIMTTWTGSIVTNILKYFDFKLYRVEDSLEYERGLLNRSEGSIPLEKIQKLTIEENPLKRIIGYSTLNIETAGYSAEQSMKQGAEAAIPLAKRDRTVKFAKMIEDFQELGLEKISKRARRRYFGRYMILAGVLTLGFLGYSLIESFTYWYWPLVLTPVAGIAAHLKWKNKGVSVKNDYFISMNGFWNRKTMVTPYYRIQNLIEDQTILQRRWKLSTLTLDIAGTNPFQQDAKASDLDTEVVKELRQEVFRNFQRSIS